MVGGAAGGAATVMSTFASGLIPVAIQHLLFWLGALVLAASIIAGFVLFFRAEEDAVKSSEIALAQLRVRSQEADVARLKQERLLEKKRISAASPPVGSTSPPGPSSPPAETKPGTPRD